MDRTINKIFFLLLFLFFFMAGPIRAADFETSHDVKYLLLVNQDKITSKVDFSVSITNKKSDTYVNKYSISFPKPFTISNLEVRDDKGEIKPVIDSGNDFTKIEMEFNNPETGRGSVNNFYLSFNQENLFKINGNIWEVILPVIENKDNSSYDVTVVLPDESHKKISLSKPTPSLITGREIRWKNPSTRTIYAVFGDSQLYRVNLSYHLRNDGLIPLNAEVAFPPDTLFQKVFVDEISEKPASVHQDEDGNFMAVFALNPKQTKSVEAKFVVQVFSKPRSDLFSGVKSLFDKQKKHLLASQQYWEIRSLEKISGLETPEEIHSFVVDTLDYSYKRVEKDNVRIGAEKILNFPKLAVCMEYADLFVAISREKGIYAREIEGYGSSSDPQLRPLSLSSDVLHAWPEYFEEKTGLWKPIDPTWQDTSGIDYYNSFDLNHVVFAIHGKKPDYPLPAGMYKIENSKDVLVTAIKNQPEENRDVAVTGFEVVSKAKKDKNYSGSITVVNTGNIYLWEIPVEIAGENIAVENGSTKIISLAPWEKRKIDFTYRFNRSDNKQGKIAVFIFGNRLTEKTVSLEWPLEIILKAAVAVVIAILLIKAFIFKIRK